MIRKKEEIRERRVQNAQGFKDKYEILHIGEDQDGHIIDLTEQ